MSKQKVGAVPDLKFLDYSRFFAAGALCCTLTHAATTPIDVVKTRIQIDPQFKKTGMLKAGRAIVAAEGPSGLLTGFGPTAVGYLVQGGTKFAGYEFMKKSLVDLSGGYDNAVKYRTAIYIGGAAVAEFVADILLTPLEATRIRLVSDRTYASGFVPAFMRMAREGGLKEFYAGFIPLLFKQIPYAIGQFAINEQAHEIVYKQMSAETRANLTPLQEIEVTLGCGVVAGFGAAILSHPADTLLSKINRGGGGSGGIISRLATLAVETGPIGMFAGLGPRMLMTAFLVSGQFFGYKIIKKQLGAEQGVEIHKE
ncbi:mitochondrial carrier [Meredithblackwellia eburnea MCA 4105]